MERNFKSIKDNKLSYYLIIISFMFIAYIGSVFIGGASLFIFGVSITKFNFVIFPVITMFIAKLVLNKDKEYISFKFLIFTLIGFFIIVGILAVINNYIWDVSYDSLAYHELGVSDLYRGWNPFYNSKDANINLWVMHYTKAPSIFAASIYKLTGTIASSKLITTLLPIILFTLSFAVFNLIIKNKKWLSIFAAIILVLNPVIIGQAFSFYVDSTLGIYVIILIINLFLILFYKDLLFFKYFALINIAVFLINIKFTGLAYAGVILFAFLIVNFIYNNKKHNTNLIVFLICGFIFSVIILGFNPYVTNTLNNGNPLYPLAGKGKINIMTNNTPKDFRNDNGFYQAYRSLVGIPNLKNVNGAKADSIQTLLGVNENTLQYYSGEDARIRGFGVYSVIFIPLSFIGALYLLITCRKKKLLISAVLTLVFIGGIAIVGGGFWWARYVPFLWAVPLLVGLFMFLRKGKLIKIIGMAFLILMFINSIMIPPYALYYKIKNSNGMKSYVFEKNLVIEKGEFSQAYINIAKQFHLDYKYIK